MELRRAVIELTLIAAYHHPSAKRPEFPKPCKPGPGSISQLIEVVTQEGFHCSLSLSRLLSLTLALLHMHPIIEALYRLFQ